MDKALKIKEALKAMHDKGHYNGSAIISGQVSAVNGIDTIDVDVDGLTYYQVQLQAILDGTGSSLIVVPKKGTLVLIGNIEQSTGYVLLKADVADRVLIKQADGMYIDVIKNVVKLNGDSKGGLVQIKELQDNLDALKAFVDAMHTALPTAFSAVLAAMASNGALGSQAYTAAMAGQQIILKDMENKNVKHG